METSPVSTDLNPFRYAALYFDSETGSYFNQARNYAPLTGRFTSPDIHWNQYNMVYGDNPGENPLPNIGAIMQSGNLYVYSTNNPVRYFDPSGFARIDTAYTYTTYKLDYSLNPDFGSAVADKMISMTKTEFTNLNATVYSLDGSGLFHTDPAALARGEYLWANDPTNLMKQPKETIALFGYGITSNLDYLTQMDKEQGWRVFNSYGKASFSTVSDIFTVFGGVLAKAGVKGVSIISNTSMGVNAAWATGNNWNDLSDSSKRTFMEFAKTIVNTYAPGFSTVADFKKAAETAGYKVEFSYK